MKQDSPFLIPPKRFEAIGGFFTMAPDAKLLLRMECPEPQLMRFVEEILPLGGKRTVEEDNDYSVTLYNVSGGFETRATDAEWQAEEGFVFTIAPSYFTVSAKTLQGMWRGCAFLKREILRGKPIPCGMGADSPDKRVRGVMLDVSRNRTYSLPTLFGFVDQMALLGLNRLELYFEKAFAFSEHFEQWGDVSPYSATDLGLLSEYCAERGVQLVPNQNTLGHFERWLKHKTYAQYHAELPEGGARTPWGTIQKKPTGLWAANQKTREFVKQLVYEVASCFPHATSMNLGGDEVFDLAEGRSKGCDKVTLYLDYMREIASVIEEWLRPELWADMLIRHPEMLPLVKQYLPTARWLVWGYEASDPLAKHAAILQAAGLDVIVCPGTSSWRSFCGRTTNMLANIRAAASVPNTDGLLLTDWGDAGHWQPLTISMPAIVAAAAYAWRADAEIDVAALTDLVLGEKGLGEVLLRLGDTYRTAKAEAGNATKLFQAYNLPLADAPEFDTEALQATLAELDALAEEAPIAGLSLAAREARYALALQRLAVLRALKTPNLHLYRARVAEIMQQLWYERGPRAQLDASLEDFLSVEMP